MFQQRNFNNLSLILIIFILSITFCQIKQPDKPNSPTQIEVIDDKRVHELHQYLIHNKSQFNGHKTLMIHPEYYVILREILNQLDEIIKYNQEQPIIAKDKLKEIDLIFEDLHFIDYHQLQTQIKNKIILNKINSLIKKPIEK